MLILGSNDEMKSEGNKVIKIDTSVWIRPIGIKVREKVSYAVKFTDSDQLIFTYTASGIIESIEHIGASSISSVTTAKRSLEKNARVGPHSSYFVTVASLLSQHAFIFDEKPIIDIVVADFWGSGYNIWFTISGMPRIEFNLSHLFSGIGQVRLSEDNGTFIHAASDFLEPEKLRCILQAVENHEKVRLKFLYREE